VERGGGCIEDDSAHLFTSVAPRADVRRKVATIEKEISLLSITPRGPGFLSGQVRLVWKRNRSRVDGGYQRDPGGGGKSQIVSMIKKCGHPSPDTQNTTTGEG